MTRPAPPPRSAYVHLVPMETRWMDNDLYGHVNNVVYYSLFDSLINRYLIKEGGLDIQRGDVLGYMVHTSCTFAGAVAFPDQLEGGLRVGHLGTSSVRYEAAIFRVGDEHARAFGELTHVFVQRDDQRPTPIPPRLRAALELLRARSSDRARRPARRQRGIE